MARRFTWKAKLFTVVGTVVLTTCAAEIGLRSVSSVGTMYITYPGERESRRTHRNSVADPLLGWRMKPAHSFVHKTAEHTVRYHSDARGARCAAEPKPPAVPRRLVVVGDSNSWGFGVLYEETYGARLAERLGGWAVSNLATPGYGVDQIYLSVRHLALPLEPDLIVVGVARIDFRRSLTAYREVEGYSKPAFVLDQGELRPMTAADRPAPLVRYLEQHSRIYNLIRHGRTERASSSWWRLNAALLDAIARDCAAAGASVVFLRIAALDRWPLLRSHMEERGLNYVDPADFPRPDGRLFFDDGHPNAAGHAWFAAAAHTWISKNLPALK